MQPRQRLAERGAVGRRWPPNPHAVEEGDHCRRTAGDLPQHLAPPVLDRLRTADAARVQVLHQGQKKRQVLGRHAPLVEGENEIAATGVDEEIRILDTFSDALIGEQLSDVVTGEKGPEVFRHHIGVDGHFYPSCVSRLAGDGKSVVSGRADP